MLSIKKFVVAATVVLFSFTSCTKEEVKDFAPSPVVTIDGSSAVFNKVGNESASGQNGTLVVFEVAYQGGGTMNDVLLSLRKDDSFVQSFTNNDGVATLKLGDGTYAISVSDNSIVSIDKLNDSKYFVQVR